MNQLCVPIPTASDTQQILDEVFALCRIPWIYDFIFFADPAADISMLLAPVQKRHALSARVFVNAVETSSRYAHSFDFNKELLFYSIPAFSVGSITAGFCVEQLAARVQKDKQLLQCIRFVRDDKNGIFLHVSENEHTGVTEVDCLTHKSSTRRTRVRMKFDMRSLRTVLKTRNGILNPTDIYPSLIYLNVSDEKRACPVCGGSNPQCDCELPLQRPSHPLDFRFEASNMGLYTGFYQGATVVRLCSAGHCVINATLQSGSVIQGESNRELKTKLHKLAVVDRLSRLKERPVKLIMPSEGVDVAEMMDADAAADVVAALSKQAGNTNNGTASAQEKDKCSDATVYININGTETPEMQNLDMTRDSEKELSQKEHTLDTDALFANAETDLNGGFETAEALLDTNELMGEMEGVVNADSKMTDTYAAETQGTSQIDLNGVMVRSGTCSSSSSKRGSSGCSSDMRGEKGNSDSDKTVVGGEGESGKSGKSVEEDGGDNSGKEKAKEKGVDKVLTEEEKAEIRKKRNREAAARSNLKRKLRNESVRRDLACLTQRAIRLRVKEMMLRDENNRLRNALRDAKIMYLPSG